MKNHKRYVYRINGVEDHIHIFISLHLNISLANLVKDLKLGSSSYITEKGLFPMFNDWQDGYSAFTYSQQAKYNLIEYVKNQEIHHRKKSFREELVSLLKEHGIEFDEKYLD